MINQLGGSMINSTNYNMIMSIMDNKYNLVNEAYLTKFVNAKYEVIVKNNSSIVVVDKSRNTQVIYKDLKTAHNQILHTAKQPAA